MRRFLSLAFVLGSALVASCESGSSETTPPQNIHPQPQPNNGNQTFTAPCNAETCGTAPGSLTSPRCKQEASGCGWSDNSSVSYRQCPESECGVAPTADVCASGTVFRGSVCGSENESVCAWNTICAPPPSTTPCAKGNDDCGPMPMIGVVCEDGGMGSLLCMQFESRCDWQASCN
jgi:hypothetical protein